ncbi:MAG TPA: PfkB family carbohydrate kinase [Thermoleophilaceae bacterium]|nr:PfkB family carbohydrate kinase [Thermoleophilaceae bacterium]
MRVAVVGHVEWIEFAEVDHVPVPGEIVHASRTVQLPGGGGAVAAVQLAKLAGKATLYTAFGDDELGHRAERELRAMGLDVQCVFRPEPQRRGLVHLDAQGERTITILGPRLGPSGDDPLPWDRLDETDAVYLTAGDVEAMRHARRARVLVASARALGTLREAGVELDILVASGRDTGERYERGTVTPEPRFVVRTLGAAGGEWEPASGQIGRWESTPLPGPLVDVYGAGDSFAAGLTYGMGESGEVSEAVKIAARCGAACATGRGPYEGQLRLS